MSDWTGGSFTNTASATGASQDVTVSSLSNGIAYYIRVKTTDGEGNVSDWTVYGGGTPTAVTPQDMTAPDAPLIGSITPGTDKVTVSVSAETGSLITVEADTSSSWDGASVLEYDTATGIAQDINIALTEGTDYYIRVKATDGAGNSSAWTVYGGGTPAGLTPLDTTAPADPSLTSGVEGDAQITVSVSAEAISTITVEANTSSAWDGTSVTETATATGASQNVAVTGLSNGTVYYVRVKAEDAAANSSGWTVWGGGTPTALTPVDNVAPAAPDMYNVRTGETQAVGQFMAESGSTITVEINTASDWSGTALTTTSTATGSYEEITISGLTSGDSYYIRAKAEDAAGNISGWSEAWAINNQKMFVASQIGEIGPGGGIVYYDDLIGYDFDNSYSIEADEKNLFADNIGLDGYRYLEVAPEGWHDGVSDPMAEWGFLSTDLEDVSNTATSDADSLAGTIGDGWGNTYYINTTSDPDSDRAAMLTENYSMGWFLPSLGELKIMLEFVDNHAGGGGLNFNSMYWSSSERSASEAWVVISGTYSEDDVAKNYFDSMIGKAPFVRAVRAMK